MFWGPSASEWCSLRITSSPLAEADCVTLRLTEMNLGGTLQLLLDLQYLAGALSPLVKAQHESVIAAARETIVQQALAIVAQRGADADPLTAQLEAWLQKAEVRLQ